MADPPWSSATDLAEYAYCPRAHHYRTTLAEPPPTPAERAGSRYHERLLSGERRRERWGGAAWALLALGIALAVLGAVAAGRG